MSVRVPWTAVPRAAVLLSVVSATVVLAHGCGGDGFPKRYPVSGNVTYKGNPVESGLISFIPVDPQGRAASGSIQKGRYRLTTINLDDGAIPGSYKIRIETREVDVAGIPEEAIKKGELQGAVAAATAKAKPRVPAKYMLTETSGLTADVKEQSNTINFDLTD